jgi:uncharacterized protein (TIGR02231 family)
MIKNTILTSVVVAFAILPAATAQTNQKLNLENATVFISGAELNSTARINLVKGENEFLFSNVAGNINIQSITVGATNGVVVESVTFQNNYISDENLSPRVKEIKDSIELMTQRRQPVSNKIAALDEQIAVLQANRKVGGDNTGLSVAELTKMLDLVGSKMESCLNQKNKEQDNLKKIDERIAALNRQLAEEQKRNYQPGGQLLVKFYAKESTSSSIAISYVVPNAGWTPVYDVMAPDAHSPVNIYYKANIYQNSGVKWNNVHLTLSTGNPQEGMQAPVLSPWYLSFYNPQPYMYKNQVMAAPRAAYSKTEELADKYVADGVQEQSTMNEYVTVDNAGINTSFDIELPYTIPSDGQQHLVAVKKYEAPATYEYFSAPKADNDAFLVAKITNWQDLNLLPGQTNIFYEGTYIGQGYIDTRNTQDTIRLSLGRDKKIIVKRERDKKLRSVKTIGSNVRETFAYTITVRNTRKDAATIVIQDQIPVSNDKDIVLEDTDAGGSDYSEATGMMKWPLTLKPNETKTVHFGFTLKYPKGKTISNLPR